MKLLILGGTRFLGYHLAAAARARQHDVTVFHRGKHAVAAVPDVETILGDRRSDLGRLRGRTWDAVIDTSGYLPRDVAAAARALSTAARQYIFISSISVYSDCSAAGLDESAPVVTLTDEQSRAGSGIDTSGAVSAPTFGELYGGLKASCERALAEVVRSLIVRCGVIAGPYDYTDRLTYWAARVLQGGEVLAPAPPHRYVQFIDVRDLTEWILRMAEQEMTGVYNATGPPRKITMEDLLETCRAVAMTDVRFTWASERFLLEEQVAPWTEMPLWLPETTMAHKAGLMMFNCQSAIASGLTYRPLHETISSILRWYVDMEDRRPLRAGLSAQRERQLLQKWRELA